MTLKEPKAASSESRNEEYIPGKGKVCVKAYQNSLVQHIFMTNLLCARHCSREQGRQLREEASRQREEQGSGVENCLL